MLVRIAVFAVLASQVLSPSKVFAQDSTSTSTSSTSISNSVSAPISIAQPVAPPKFKANVDILVIGRQIDDKYFNTTNSLTAVVPRIDVIYNSWMSFDLELCGLFVTGNSKNLYTTEGKGTDVLLLDEVAMTLTPTKELEFRAGALLTKINPIYSIMTESTFLGTTQKYSFHSSAETLVLSATANEAVPSAGSVTPGLINDAPNAYFVTGTLAADLNLNALNSKFKFATTSFQFGNLSSNVASDSRFIGNSPKSFDGIGDLSRFTIGFGGFETAVSFKTEWTKSFSTELVGSTIVNDKAPGDRNNGAQGFLKIKKLYQNFNVIPSVGMFNMAADVTPAAYTISPYRYHNRKGYFIKTAIELEKQKLEFFASFTRFDVLQDTVYLADRNMFNLGVEAKYDFL